MSSPFATRMAAIGAPLGIRHNSEPVTIRSVNDVELTLKAIVELDDMNSAAEGFIVVTGRLLIETAIVLRKVIAIGTVIHAVARGEQWHVYDQSGDRDGWTHFNLRRKVSQSSHTNIYDLDDNQAVWHS